MKKAIIIMAKVPEAGKVKTRLNSEFTALQSAEISKAFLQDVKKKASNLNKNVFIAFSPPNKKNRLMDMIHDETNLIEQVGETLGDKMFNAFLTVFERGFDSAVMIGTDSPTFPPESIKAAFDALELNHDIVIGKTDDGGFYLVGMKKANKGVFESVTWSSENTFYEFRENIAKQGLSIDEVESWYDVDEPKDVKRLVNEFSQDQKSRERAPKTFEVIKKWRK